MYSSSNSEMERVLSTDSVITQINFLKGKVLTIIDASFPEGNQRKAVKDLINQAFYSQISHVESFTVPTDLAFGNLQQKSDTLIQ